MGEGGTGVPHIASPPSFHRARKRARLSAPRARHHRALELVLDAPSFFKLQASSSVDCTAARFVCNRACAHLYHSPHDSAPAPSDPLHPPSIDRALPGRRLHRARVGRAPSLLVWGGKAEGAGSIVQCLDLSKLRSTYRSSDAQGNLRLRMPG
ncbi:hypothetical protein C8F04DRAFT_1145983 [Mycena alexandri]|uniref:Uncharacterized protein n=1 Tax=Mycena alexandri TaxID=1745969 RepID=A0AAD6S4V3_9AGAR|nr:hypothetical protein C8F04DRAFT_1145983 [Mycena alexandri]